MLLWIVRMNCNLKARFCVSESWILIYNFIAPTCRHVSNWWDSSRSLVWFSESYLLLLQPYKRSCFRNEWLRGMLVLMNNWQINKDRSRRMSDDKTSENKMAHYCRQSEALNTNAHVCRLILLFVLTVAAPLSTNRQTGGIRGSLWISEETSAHYWRHDGSAVYIYVCIIEDNCIKQEWWIMQRVCVCVMISGLTHHQEDECAVVWTAMGKNSELLPAARWQWR